MSVNLYSSKVHPRRVFPINLWVEGLSDYNKTGGSYLWARGIDYRTDPSQITLLPAAVQEVGQSLIAGTIKWGEQVVGRTVTLGNTTNLIPNGSFETNTTGWTLGADYTRSSTKAYVGTFAIKQVSASGTNAFTTASGSGIAVNQFTDYQLVFYTNVVVSSGAASLLQVLGNSLAGSNLLPTALVLSDTGGNWTQVTATFNSGTNTSVFISIANNGGALTAYYDNFSLLQINSLATFGYDNLGNLYKRYSNASWVPLHNVPNSHGNGMAYYGEDDFLYYTADKTLGRYGTISSGVPTFTDDFLTAQGGVPTNTNSANLIAANSDYWVKATPSSALKITGNIALEAFVKPASLPAVGSSMTIMGLWGESGNHRGYKMDVLGISGYFGDGSDGSLTISSNTTESPIDSACSGSSGTNTLNANNVSFAAGQKIWIVQMRGTGAGTQQRTTIQSYDSTNHIITTTDNLNFSYNSTGNNAAQVRVLKQYTNVTINTGCIYKAKDWNSATGTGGILAFIANGTVTITGSIVADGTTAANQYVGGEGAGATGGGFYGGNGGNSSGHGNGFAGEGTAGVSVQLFSSSQNGSGGGNAGNSSGIFAGGGGGNGTAGVDGTHSASGGGGFVGLGGLSSGSADLTSITMGGGGGGGNVDLVGGVSGGGSGGGIIFITGVTITGTGTVSANGGAGGGASYGAGGGGGGGSIWFKSQNGTLSGLTITAQGGIGGVGRNDNDLSKPCFGGNGGSGRVTLDYLVSQSGSATPTLNVIQDTTLVTTTTYQLRFGVSNDGTAFEYLAQNLMSLSVGNWDRLQISWVAATSTASFYEGGTLIGTAVGTKTSISASTADFAIGANVVSAYANFFDGYINDARVWNGTRTQAQFAANNLVNLGGVAAGLVGSWLLTASPNDQTSSGNNLTATGSPTPGYVTDVPYAGATTRLDIDQTGGGTANTFTLGTAIVESSLKTFTPAHDPQKSLQINIGAKGTGDWTLYIHDALNRLVTSITVTNANLPSSGTYEFVFADVWIPVVGATYHFHITSTVADGTVKTTTASDFTTTSFTTFFQFLVNDTEYHPMMQMINALGIGNGRYLAIQDAAAGYNERRLRFPAGWRVRCLATWRGYFAIGCWKGTSIKDFDQGIVFLWDGYSVTYNDFFYVPEGAINAMYGQNGVLYIIAGYKGDLLEYTGGDEAKKVKRLPKIGKANYIEVEPGGMTYWQALLRIAASYNSDSTTFERGVYTWGTLNEGYAKSLSFDYPISTGNRGSTVSLGALVPVGGNLLVCWQDNVSHGVDNVNVSNAPQTTGTLEELITDFDMYWKNKEELTVRADHLPLRTGENIDVKYKINYEANWHNLGITSQLVGDTNTRLPLSATAASEFHAIQIATDLYAASGTAPTILEHSHDIDLLVTESDENNL